MIPRKIYVDKELLLKETNGGLMLFEKRCGPLEEIKPGKMKNVLNPCYNDTEASLSITFWEKGNRWWYHDYGDETYDGDCFRFVEQYMGEEWSKGKTFPDILLCMAELCEVDLDKVTKKKEDSYKSSRQWKREKEEAECLAASTAFKEYAQSFEWTQTILDEYRVQHIVHKPMVKQLPHSLFKIEYIGDGFKKLYTPVPKRFRWEGEKPKDYVFGLREINLRYQNIGAENMIKGERRNILVFAAGEKDVITLACKEYDAISLNSETIVDIPENLRSVFSRYEKVVVLYDRDETGIKSTLDMCEKYPELAPCILPKELADAGGKDISDYVSLGMNMGKVELLIDNADRSGLKEVKELLAEMKTAAVPEQLEVPPLANENLSEEAGSDEKEARSKRPLSIAEMREKVESKNQKPNPIEQRVSDKVHVPELITEPTLSSADITIDQCEYQEANDNSSPCIDSRLYVKLPVFFQKLMRHFTDLHSRDIAFLSVLVTISAVLFRFKGIYGGRFMGTNLFGFISAPAGSGKGAAIYSRFLVTGINQKIKAQYQKDIAYFEAESKGNPALEEPLPRMLLIPGNSSCAAIYNVLGGNENFGLLHETEADTISASFKNDWANYDDLLRKAAMHEPISSNRVNRTLSVERPSLSVLLTGTPNQIASLIPSAENGLFSRFLYYRKSGRDSWMNQFEESQEDLEGRFKKYGEEVTQWWDRQQAFESDITIKLSKEQQDETNKYFSQKLMELQELFDIDIDASVKRYGLLHFRICMILTAIGTLGEDSDIGNCIVVSDIDFDSSLIIMDCLFKHLSVVFTKLKRAEKNRVMDVQSILSVDQLKLFNALPNEFEKKDADQLSLSLGLSSNCHKMLDKYLKHNLIKKIGHGKYQKNDEYED